MIIETRRFTNSVFVIAHIILTVKLVVRVQDFFSDFFAFGSFQLLVVGSSSSNIFLPRYSLGSKLCIEFIAQQICYLSMH